MDSRRDMQQELKKMQTEAGLGNMIKFGIGWVVFSVAMTVGGIGFAIWVIIKVMQHFSVI